MINILFSAPRHNWAEYKNPLRTAFRDVDLRANLKHTFPPEDVDYIIVAPNGNLENLTPYSRLKAVFSLWAGIEHIVDNPTLRVPLARMVDPALTQGMVEWVTGHVLRHHLGMDRHILAAPGEWNPNAPPLAPQRKVAVLGLGELGSACAHALARLGFCIWGWSRSHKLRKGMQTRYGVEGLEETLTHADIVILLLPATQQTENIMNAQTLRLLAPGAFVINPGRGSLIDDAALLGSLDAGHIAHATLDVFRTEPLPPEHPYWRHPSVTVTPHIASETRADSASQSIAQNIKRAESNQPILYPVDHTLGY